MIRNVQYVFLAAKSIAEPATLSMKITVNTMQFVMEHTSEKPQIRSKSDFVNTLMITDCVHKNQQCTHIRLKSIAGKEVGFKVKVQGVCQGDPLLRQCMEAVLKFLKALFFFMDFILEEKCTWLGIEI